ncbi:hypothetical protein BDZ97DRAFT_1858367 [Flammula alnicola]|nr:hypothetical protein BDZ97DRAFT_1858367 [Flammula alnicola]
MIGQLTMKLCNLGFCILSFLHLESLLACWQSRKVLVAFLRRLDLYQDSQSGSSFEELRSYTCRTYRAIYQSAYTQPNMHNSVPCSISSRLLWLYSPIVSWFLTITMPKSR